MSFRTYLILMFVGTFLAWGGWLLVLGNVDPREAGVLGISLFYVTLLMSLVGSITLFGLLVRIHVLGRRDVVVREVKISFRHAVMLSAVSIVSLIFSRQGWLSWWVLVVFIVIAGVFEYLSLLIQHSRRG